MPPKKLCVFETVCLPPTGALGVPLAALEKLGDTFPAMLSIFRSLIGDALAASGVGLYVELIFLILANLAFAVAAFVASSPLALA